MSSRRGCARRARWLPRRSRTLRQRWTSSGSASGPSTSSEQAQGRRPVLEGAGLGDPEGGRRPGSVVLPQYLDQLGGRPHVGQPLDAVATVAGRGVRVQRAGQAALGGAQPGEQEVAGLQRDPAAEGVAGQPPPVQVDAGQQRVVVEHLLEVRHHPARRPRCTARSRPPAGRRCRWTPCAATCSTPCPGRAAPLLPGAVPVRAACRSSHSSTMDGGNLGAPPKPPFTWSCCGASERTQPADLPRWEVRRRRSRRPARPAAPPGPR